MGSGKQLPDGTIVRAPRSVFGDRVYFVSRGRRHWICDASWFEQDGRVWPDDVRDVSPELLASFLPGGPAPRAWTEEDMRNPSADLGSLALREIAGSRLRGMGVEFGAGASPYPVPLECRVLFADRLAHVELSGVIGPRPQIARKSLATAHFKSIGWRERLKRATRSIPGKPGRI